MKNQIKKHLSLFLALTMVLTIFVSISVPTAAANYVYNWGEREVDCTELSDAAEAFYTGIYVFEDMSKTQGGSSQSNAHQSALYGELQSLMQTKHTYTTSYAATKDMYQYTDCENGGGKISSFYSGKEIGPSWGSSPSWNREHTWPDSKGLGGKDETDIMMLRPTATSENSSRGNTAYGKSSGYYNPNSESNGSYDLRGDVARICLYVYTRWGNTSYMWGTSGVMESLTVLLEWMEADPVDTWEMGRNDSVQSITGTRNVFVDYPEYAWLLFGRDVPAGITTPSGNAGATGGTNAGEATGSGSGGGSNSGSTGGTTATEMTVEQALAAADGTLITVTGTIKSIDSQYAWNGTSMSAYLGDDNGNEIYLYKLATEVKVGDNVTITGERYTYVKNSTSLDELKNISNVTINTSSGGSTGGSTGGNTGSGSTGGTTGGGTSTTPSGNKITYIFENYEEGTQYANNEVHKLDDVLTVTTNDAHFRKEIRLYHNDNAQYGVHHATAVFQSTKAIKAFSLKAGGNEDTLKVSGSNDGENWTLVDEISVVSAYADYNVDMNGAEYTYIKLEPTAKQIKVVSVGVEYVGASTSDPDSGNSGTTNPDSGNSGTTNPDNGNGSTTPPQTVTTIADALSSPDGTSVSITGTVKSVEEWNTQYNNMDFIITDDAGNELQVFRSSTKVAVGDTVAVVGTMSTYNGVREVAQGATVTVVSSDGGTTTPDPDDGNGGTTTPDPDDGNGSTTTPDPDDGNGSTTTPDPDDGNGSTTTPDPDDGNGSTTTPDPDDGNGGTTTPDPDDGNGSTTTPDPDDGNEDAVTSDDPAPDAPVVGCGSAVGGGVAVILAISLAGIAMFRKKKED